MPRGRGLALSLFAATAVTVGGYLGGHLTYRHGVNVDRNAWHEGAAEWVEVAQETELEEGSPVAARAGDDAVLLLRQADQIQALSGGGPRSCHWPTAPL